MFKSTIIVTKFILKKSILTAKQLYGTIYINETIDKG